jgi:hypothetical protein
MNAVVLPFLYAFVEEEKREQTELSLVMRMKALKAEERSFVLLLLMVYAHR